MRQAFPADPVLSAVDRLIDKCSAADVLDAKEIGCELAALRDEVVSLAKSLMSPIDPSTVAIAYHDSRMSPVPCWAALGARSDAAKASMRVALAAAGARITDEENQ